MTVKELKKVIETLPNDFEVVISADIGGNRPFNFCEAIRKEVSEEL